MKFQFKAWSKHENIIFFQARHYSTYILWDANHIIHLKRPAISILPFHTQFENVVFNFLFFLVKVRTRRQWNNLFYIVHIQRGVGLKGDIVVAQVKLPLQVFRELQQQTKGGPLSLSLSHLQLSLCTIKTPQTSNNLNDFINLIMLR